MTGFHSARRHANRLSNELAQRFEEGVIPVCRKLNAVSDPFRQQKIVPDEPPQLTMNSARGHSCPAFDFSQMKRNRERAKEETNDSRPRFGGGQGREDVRLFCHGDQLFE